MTLLSLFVIGNVNQNRYFNKIDGLVGVIISWSGLKLTMFAGQVLLAKMKETNS